MILQEISLSNSTHTDIDSYFSGSSNINTYATDLTFLAMEGILSPANVRDSDLSNLLEILIRRYRNNPLIIGEPGIGKTTLITLLATRIVKNLVPFMLEGRSIISLDLLQIIYLFKTDKDFESSFKHFLQNVLDISTTILFIDDLHLLYSNNIEGIGEILNILKPFLINNGLQCIGTSLLKEYGNIEKDTVLLKAFYPFYLIETTVEDTLHILYNLRPSLETFYNININTSALQATVELANKYIFDTFFPEKAINLLDRSASKLVLNSTNLSYKLFIHTFLRENLHNIVKLRFQAAKQGDIATEYILQEIENAYQIFLFEGLENPLSVVVDNHKNLSPISRELFIQLQTIILTHINNLFFPLQPKKNLNSRIKTLSCLTSLTLLSTYSCLDNISLTIFQLTPLRKKYYNYLCFYRQMFPVIYSFLVYDHETFNNFKRKDNFKDSIFQIYTQNIQPLIYQGLINSLKYSATLMFSKKEIIEIEKFLNFTYLSNTNLFSLKKPTVNSKSSLTHHEIKEMVSQIINISIQSLSASETQKLLNLESLLHNRVIGQEEAISAVAKAIRRARLGLQNPLRPIASFLFCGPTGVGKTEITKALAAIMYGSEKEMIRFDMSEFMEKFTISRLIGSPPGYIGYEEGGQLTNAVRLKPHSIVLFDEIEKAHPDILNILLQILEDGRLTDSKKSLVKFENTIIILTSNAAAEEIQYILKTEDHNFKVTDNENIFLENKNDLIDNYAGLIKTLDSPITENYFVDIKQQLTTEFKKSFRYLKTYKAQILRQSILTPEIQTNNFLVKLRESVLNALHSIFLPEFLNRLDDIIIFLPLKFEELRKICDILIDNLNLRIKSKKLTLKVDESVKRKLTKEGYNPLYGARPLRRLITKYLEDLLSDYLLKTGNSNREQILNISLNDKNQICII